MKMVDDSHLSFDEKQFDLLKRLDQIAKGINSNSNVGFLTKLQKGYT